MKTYILMLLIVFIQVLVLNAQTNQVTIRLNLYPIQLVEVDTDKELGFDHARLEQGDMNLLIEQPDQLNTYSTSHFALKVKISPLENSPLSTLKSMGNPPEPFKDSQEDSKATFAAVVPDPVLQVMYSMEAL